MFWQGIGSDFASIVAQDERSTSWVLTCFASRGKLSGQSDDEFCCKRGPQSEHVPLSSYILFSFKLVSKDLLFWSIVLRGWTSSRIQALLTRAEIAGTTATSSGTTTRTSCSRRRCTCSITKMSKTAVKGFACLIMKFFLIIGIRLSGKYYPSQEKS